MTRFAQNLLLLLLILGFSAAAHHEFDFGVATSAFQTEGAWLEDGKSFTIWDDYEHTQGLIIDNSTAEIAADSYHLFHQDVALMKEYGIKHYRMSVAWARILPGGKAGTPVNMKAIEHYRAMLSTLRQAGIKTYVNLHHNDLPASMRIADYAGAYEREFVGQFVNYANISFTLLGDLVDVWFTFDEPWVLSTLDKFQPYETNTKPYILAHHYLLSHAYAVKLYREKFAAKYHGTIGINLLSEMCWPLDPSRPGDVAAAKRHIMFQLGWFAEPLMTGDYPQVMKDRVGDRLPKFTDEEKAVVNGSVDFFALNHYFSWMVTEGKAESRKTYSDDINVTRSYKPEWEKTDMGWPIVPEGIHDLLVFLNKQWVHNRVPIWVTENGVAVKEPTMEAALNDSVRIDYTAGYIEQVFRAREDGVDVRKYFTWSLVDNFEWWSGIAKRFGMTRIEYGQHPTRTPKSSIVWYGELIKQFAQ